MYFSYFEDSDIVTGNNSESEGSQLFFDCSLMQFEDSRIRLFYKIPKTEESELKFLKSAAARF